MFTTSLPGLASSSSTKNVHELPSISFVYRDPKVVARLPCHTSPGRPKAVDKAKALTARNEPKDVRKSR